MDPSLDGEDDWFDTVDGDEEDKEDADYVAGEDDDDDDDDEEEDDKIVELGSDDENDNEVSFAPVGGHLTCFAHLILLVALS